MERDRWSLYISLFTLAFTDYGPKPGYGESVVVGEVASGILFLIAAIPLLISRIATFERPWTLLREERQRGVSVWLVGLNPDVLSVIKRSPLGDVLGRERMHFNLEVAVAKYLAAPLSESATWSVGN